MSQTIKLKRSAVAGKVPTTSSLDLGEIALNTNDGKVFFKKDDGTPSIQTIVTTNSVTTGSINLAGAVSASFFTGSFDGDGSNLDNIRLFISGIDLDSNNVAATFSKLHFDSGTGIYVSASDANTAFVELGSHFRDIFVDGSSTLIATGSDQLDVIGGNGIDVTTSLTDTNSNSVSKELIFSVDSTIATTGSNTFNDDQVINGNLTVTSLTETSTRELKENIESLVDQSTIVDFLQPVSYTWKDSKEEDFGLIAEDVEEIAPHLVHRNEDGKPTGIKYSKLSVLLLDVVQRQNILINDLNERITKLENDRGN